MRPKNSPTPEVFDLRIDSLSYHGGRGVGRFEGVVVFVPGTAPGDLARVRVTQRKSNLIEAELIEIVEASGDRRTPPCPVAARCGGCSWQHVSYVRQLAEKDRILRSALRRLDPTWLPIIAAPEEFHYRNRIQLQVRGSRWGFFAARSRDLVEFDECFIAEPALNEERRRRDPRDFPGARKIEFARTADGGLRVMPGERDPEAALFSQVNTAQNERLRARVRESLRPDTDWWMDLYAGAGNFTGCISEALPRATGLAVELSRSSVARGRAAHPGVEWIAGDVGRTLHTRARPEGRGVVLVDPPRVGCDRWVIGELRRLGPDRILYVSCNPATFARDAERLSDEGCFVLEWAQGLDMFPQTEHVELIASFRSRSSVLA